tara:strand:+ start:119 stop:355 length:237 start_codon:yes stop_codon:yes gene_type:complete
MVNNGNGDIVPVSYKNRIVGESSQLTCFKCKKCYEPCDEEICIKNPNRYYKNCNICRTKMNIYAKKYIENRMLNKNIV